MAGDGIAPNAQGLTASFYRASPVPLDNVGAFEVSLPRAFRSFVVRFPNGEPVAGAVKLSAGTLDSGAMVAGAGVGFLGDVIDPQDTPSFSVALDTRKLYVHVVTAQAGLTLEIQAIDGVAFPAGRGAVQTKPVALAENTNSDVTISGGSGVILSANGQRRGFSIRNKGDTRIHLRFAPQAATTDDYPLDPGDVYEHPLPSGYVYQGEIRAIDGAVPTTVPNVARLEWT
ncbi:MAG: hypothetical protein L6R43_18455 [Planctomycetes bacterium]|nr:hypothetical protein [Planctomycetota bacterium]